MAAGGPPPYADLLGVGNPRHHSVLLGRGVGERWSEFNSFSQASAAGHEGISPKTTWPAALPAG